jgi:hypothetical protein
MGEENSAAIPERKPGDILDIEENDVLIPFSVENC